MKINIKYILPYILSVLIALSMIAQNIKIMAETSPPEPVFSEPTEELKQEYYDAHDGDNFHIGRFITPYEQSIRDGLYELYKELTESAFSDFDGPISWASFDDLDYIFGVSFDKVNETIDHYSLIPTFNMTMHMNLPASEILLAATRIDMEQGTVGYTNINTRNAVRYRPVNARYSEGYSAVWTILSSNFPDNFFYPPESSDGDSGYSTWYIRRETGYNYIILENTYPIYTNADRTEIYYDEKFLIGAPAWPPETPASEPDLFEDYTIPPDGIVEDVDAIFDDFFQFPDMPEGEEASFGDWIMFVFTSWLSVMNGQAIILVYLSNAVASTFEVIGAFMAHIPFIVYMLFIMLASISVIKRLLRR